MKIEKKDLVYWVIILIGINIFTLTGRVSSDTTLINYVNFAGTVTSIILAVVAIIYSYYQSSAFENTSSLLKESADSVKEVTNDLKSFKVDDLTDEIERTIDQFNNSLTNLEKSLTHTFTNMNHSLEQHSNSITMGVREIMDGKLDDFMKTNSINKDKTISAEIIRNLPLAVIPLMYYVYKVSKENRIFDIGEFVNFVITSEKNIAPWESNNGVPDNMYENVIGGYYLAYWQLGIFNGWYKYGEIEERLITDINKDFINVIKERIELDKESIFTNYAITKIDNLFRK